MDSQGHSKKRPVYRIAGAEQSVARETGIYCVPLGRDCHLFRPRRKRDCTGSVQVPMTTPAAATPSASPCGWLDASLARDSRTNTAGTAPRVSAFAARESRIWESRLFVLFAVAKRDGSPNRNGTVIFYVPDGEGTVPAVFGRQAPRLLPPRHPHHPAPRPHASHARASLVSTAGTAPRVSAFAARKRAVGNPRLFVLFAVPKRDGSPESPPPASATRPVLCFRPSAWTKSHRTLYG